MTEYETIAAYYAAFNAQNYEAMLALLTDDVAHDINQGNRETGLETFRRFLAHMDGCYTERLEDITILTAPNRAAAEFTVHGTYKKADAGLPPARHQTYTLPAGAFFTLSAGKIARVTTYYNLPEWLRQVSAA